MKNYSTKLFIGMDISEKTIKIYALSSRKDDGDSFVVDNNQRSVNEFVDEVKAVTESIVVAMETGTHSPWLSRLLELRGCKVLVGHARKLRMIWNDDKKCDDRDAEMLARIAKLDPKLLHPVKHNSRENMADLAVIKARDSLVKMSTQLTNTIRGLLRSFGVKDLNIILESFANKISTHIPSELSAALDPLVAQLKEIRKTIVHYDKELERLCRKHPETAKLRQIKGVGPVTALTFALIMADPHRFSSGGRVGSYLGLVPRRDQSGDVDKQLGITKAGNCMLRRNLTQAANYIMGPFGPDCDLRRYGERIAARGGKIARRKSKTAVARKLAVVLWRLWQIEEPYDPDYKRNKRLNRKQTTAA